jgi:putative intracellular protease/amidase
VVSYHAIPMVADSTLSERQEMLFDAIVLPGGPQGSVNLAASSDVVQFIKAHDAAGKLICPICSAAARVLGGNNLLNGRRYVCSGDLYQQVRDGEYVDAPVVEDGNLISGKGLGHAFDFAFTLAARLLGDEKPVRDHADHIYYRW